MATAAATRALLNEIAQRMLEVDVRNGIEAIRAGTSPGEGTAQAIGLHVLADVSVAFDLDSDELRKFAQTHSELQTDAMLANLRLTLTEEGLQLVRGSTMGGMLTGLRVGLLIADQRDRERSAG